MNRGPRSGPHTLLLALPVLKLTRREGEPVSEELEVRDQVRHRPTESPCVGEGGRRVSRVKRGLPAQYESVGRTPTQAPQPPNPIPQSPLPPASLNEM